MILNKEEVQMNATKKKIIQYDIYGTKIAIHESMSAAAITIGSLAKRPGISNCCSNKLVTAHGYQWRYYDAPPPDAVDTGANGGKIAQYDLSSCRLLTLHDSIEDAAISMGGRSRLPVIARCCNGGVKSAFNYVWHYENDKPKSAVELPVKQYTPAGRLVKIHKNLSDASYANCASDSWHFGIKSSCEGRVNVVHGYLWCYAEQVTPL
jgi:hypothetical protein